MTDPAPYFYSCVKHLALDWQRNRQRQSRREEATARSEAITFFAGPLEESERRSADRVRPAQAFPKASERCW